MLMLTHQLKIPDNFGAFNAIFSFFLFKLQASHVIALKWKNGACL